MSVLEYMIINHKGKEYKYMINTQLEPHVQDKICEDILKYFPSDTDINFKTII
jgi:hypothetical protein